MTFVEYMVAPFLGAAKKGPWCSLGQHGTDNGVIKNFGQVNLLDVAEYHSFMQADTEIGGRGLFFHCNKTY